MGDGDPERPLRRFEGPSDEPDWYAQTPDDPEFRTYRPDFGRGPEPYRGPINPGGWGNVTPDDPELRSYRPRFDRSNRPSGPFAGVGPRGYRRSDERILEDVCERLTIDGDLDASDINVKVEAGEVTLRGIVADRMAKRLAERLAETVRGVVDVHNQLLLRARPGFRPERNRHPQGDEDNPTPDSEGDDRA